MDTWWQTETGAIMISRLPGTTPAKPGSATRALPGVSAALVDENGKELSEGTGLLVLTKPWPSMLATLYGDDERFVATYSSRLPPTTYVVGDAARRDADGYFWIVGRVDDVISVSGHRLTDDLPKTGSAKIVRRLLRDIAEGRELGDVTTLRDPEVMQLKDKVEARPDAE